MVFRLKNPLVTFQAYIPDCIWPYIDDCAICDLDDILIYLINEKEHEMHVQRVLQQLCPFSIHSKAKKCQFGAPEISILGFIIS